MKPTKKAASYHFVVVIADANFTAFSEITGNFLRRTKVFVFSTKSVSPTNIGSQ